MVQRFPASGFRKPLQRPGQSDIHPPPSVIILAGLRGCFPLFAAAAWYLTFSRGEETVIMAKTVAKIMGLVLLLVGVLGFTHLLDPLGAHLSPAHNLVHILTGVISLYFGFAGSLSGAKGFCIIFGLVYLLLGILGLAMGELHIGPLMLGKVDHGIHLIVGAIFLAGGLFTRNP
jgi:hypothetical protein